MAHVPPRLTCHKASDTFPFEGGNGIPWPIVYEGAVMHAQCGDTANELTHTSRRVWCPRHARTAVINLVERRAAHRTLHSIVWCSLRDADQCCAEDCVD